MHRKDKKRFYDKWENCIRPSGDGSSKVMVVYGQPSEVMADSDEFFPDKTVKKFLTECELHVDSVWVTGAIKQWHKKGYKAKKSDFDYNRPFFEEEIKKVKPKVVLLIGAEAVKFAINEKITDVMGDIIERDGIKYVSTFNPSIVYMDRSKEIFINRAREIFKIALSGGTIELPELNYHVLTSVRDVKQAVKTLKRSVAYDIETTGLDRHFDDITLFGFGTTKVQYIIPLDCKYSPLKNKLALQRKLVRVAIKELNKHCKNRIAGNGKFDNLFCMQKTGIKIDQTFDVVLASHCLDENTPNGLKVNAMLYADAPRWDVNINLKTGNIKNYLDYEDYIKYLAYDIYYTYKLYPLFKKRIKKESLTNVYYEIYMPAIKGYEIIEFGGVQVREKRYRNVEKELNEKISEVEKKLSKFDPDVNWGSPKQVGEYLFEKAGLPVLEKTAKGEPSTSTSVLKRLSKKSEVASILLDYRKLAIQRGMFIDSWRDFLVNGRMYPSFGMLLVTGRTNCKNPNLQQVPNDPRVRSLIGAREGYTFVEADFSQAELRVACIYSGDKTMEKIYNEGGDIHTHTYEMVSGEKISDDPKIKKAQRKTAKAVNFGFLYDMGAKTYVEYARDSYDQIVTLSQAKAFRQGFFNAYSSLPQWHNDTREIARSQGYVISALGRKRRLPDILSSDRSKASSSERQAINSPVQSLGSDLLLLGMAEVLQTSHYIREETRLDLTKFHCMGTVHDACLFEVRDDYLVEFLSKVKPIMEKPLVLEEVFKFNPPVPMIVDLSIGDSWGEEIELEDDWKKVTKKYLREKRKKE